MNRQLRAMAWRDGELDADETARFEADLARDPELVAIVRALDRLDAELVPVLAARVQAAPDLSGPILARVRAEPVRPGMSRLARVIPLAAAGLAAAAAAAFALRAPEPSQHAPIASVSQGVAVSAAPEPVAVAQADDDPGVAIESVDFGSGEGTIFMVSEGESDTPVVWLNDDGPGSGAPL